MFESVLTLQAEHDELQSQLADPELHANPARSKKVNRRYAELSRIIAAWNEWKEIGDNLEAARELADEDDSFAVESMQRRSQLEGCVLGHHETDEWRAIGRSEIDLDLPVWQRFEHHRSNHP